MFLLQGKGRPRRQRPGRISRLAALGACAALAAAPPGIAAASGPPVPVDAPDDGLSMVPATVTLPVTPRHLPETFSLPLLAISRPEMDRPVIAAFDLTLSPPQEHREPAVFDVTGFSGRLMVRMRREALRYRRQNIADVLAAPGRMFADLDSEALAKRSREASRIVTRSVRRSLDGEIERLARTSLGLGPTIDLLGQVSSRGLRPQPPAGGAASLPAGAPLPAFGAPAGRWRGGIGMRLDAHPALVMRTDSPRFAGRLELPVRNEPIRLSLECPVGPRGRAVLSSGMPRAGQGWATVTISFGF